MRFAAASPQRLEQREIVYCPRVPAKKRGDGDAGESRSNRFPHVAHDRYIFKPQ